ncbi:MAG: hypothetical protein U1F16_18575 [Turneriella sp.]
MRLFCAAVSLICIHSLLAAEAVAKMRFLPGAIAMKDEILLYVKPGMQVQRAAEIMQHSGFVCQRKFNTDFLATDHGKSEHQYLKSKNYLYCDHTEPGFFMLTAARRWQVALLIADEKITEVYVSYGLIGP